MTDDEMRKLVRREVRKALDEEMKRLRLLIDPPYAYYPPNTEVRESPPVRLRHEEKH